MLIQQAHILALNFYKHIYYTYPYGERAGEFTAKDEKMFEIIYRDWRKEDIKVTSCDECVEEAFNRLMLQMLSQTV